MCGNLRKEESDQRRVCGKFVHLGLIVKIAAGKSPGRAEAVLDVALNSPNAGPAEVLPLLKVRTDCDVRNRILHSIVEPGRSHRHVAHRRDVDSKSSAGQTLWSELIVCAGQDLADGELAVQLVESWGAESEAEVAPDADLIGRVKDRGHARADYGVVAVIQAGGRHAA